MKRREFLKSMTAVAAGGALPAAPAVWSPAKAQARQETLLIVSESGPNNIDIHGVGTTVPGYEVSWNCYDRLISHEMKTDPNGTPYYDRDKFKPELADDMKIGDMSVTFTLKKNAVFHDGTPVDVAAVKFNIGRLMDKQRNPTNRPLWDPVAVRFCQDAGVGARFALRIGGKCGPESGDPLDLTVEVRGLNDELAQWGLGRPSVMGRAAWVECDGVHIVLVERREQAFSPELFTNMGLPLSEMRIAVVKSTAHFRAGFAPIAAEILTTIGPGALLEDFPAIPYRKRSLNYWPRVEDPFATQA